MGNVYQKMKKKIITIFLLGMAFFAFGMFFYGLGRGLSRSIPQYYIEKYKQDKKKKEKDD